MPDPTIEQLQAKLEDRDREIIILKMDIAVLKEALEEYRADEEIYDEEDGTDPGEPEIEDYAGIIPPTERHTPPAEHATRANCH